MRSVSGRGKWGPRKVARPCGERRAHRSGEGCPECNGGSARLKRRLRPTQRRLNGAYKEPRAHLPPPNLPRFGGGERPPFSCKPIAPLTITMGQRLGSLQALTPRECYSRFIVASPSGPLSRHRERGWGERADTPVATLGAILCAVRIDFRLPSKINPYPAQPATGVLGQRPKRVLVPFTRVKGTPRRRAVQALHPAKSSRRL